MARALAIVNPIAGRGAGQRVFEEIERRLAAAGIAVDAAITDQAGDAQMAASRVADHDVVVVVGGDGTLNEAINGLEADVPVAHCPLGTGNVLAKELGIPRDVGRFCKMVVAGHERTLDVGAANSRRFVLMTSAGFDAAVTEDLHAKRRGAIRIWHYAGPLLRRLLGGYSPRLRVSIDGGEPLEAGGLVLVSNVRSYGGPLCVAPDAVPDDGQLDVCFLPWGLRLGLLRALVGCFLRCQRTLGGLRYCRGRSIEATADERVPFQVDGDPAGCLPLTVELLERKLRVVVP